MIATDLRASLTGVFRIGLGIAIGVGAVGCGGGKGTQAYPDAIAPAGTGGRGATGADAGGTGGARPDGGAPTDAAVPPGSVRLLPGIAALLSPGPSCSQTVTAAGAVPSDRWCAVIRPGAAGTITLSVVNLTRAIAGTVPTCTAGDANCLQLSANLSTATDAASGFFGDTLVYYEAQSVLAWRPGWTAGRILVPHDQLASCAAGSATAICVKATANPAILNLYAGRIDTQTGDALALIEPIDSTVGSINFSVDLMSVLWSTRTGAAAPETLKMQTIGDAATRRTVATNVTDWRQSPDGTRWLWLSQPTLDPVAMVVTGTLQTAPFPAGTAPTTVHAAVVQYGAWTEDAVMVLATPGPLGFDLKAIADIANPVASATVIEAGDAVGFTDLTTNGTVLYSTDFTQPDPLDPATVLINLLTSKANATGKCTLTTTPSADPSSYLTRSGLGAAWVRPPPATSTSGLFEGLFTTLAGCATSPFSTTLSAFLDGLGGIVLLESFNQTAFTAALSLSPYVADGTVQPKVLIHPAANPTVMPLFPDTPRVVYSVNQTAIEGGIYVSAPLDGVVQLMDLAPSSGGGFATDGASARMAAATRTGTGAIRVGGLAATAATRATVPRALRTSLLPAGLSTHRPLTMPRRLPAVSVAVPVPTAARARPSAAASTR